MAGIAVLLPNEQLMAFAPEIMKENKNIVICKRISKDTAVEEAKKSIEAGASVIVARGHQAALIESAVNVPVSEIVWTAQEVGLTILEARRQIEKPRPTIGIIGLMSMFCDVSYFEKLYDVGIKSYFYQTVEQTAEAIEWVKKEHVDVIIGERRILQTVKMSFPDLHTVVMVVTGESLKIAIRYADTLLYATEMERHNKAQMNSLLDSAFNGLLQIDQNGTVIMMNRVMETILQMNQSSVLGRDVRSVIREINAGLIEQVLHNPLESFSTFLNVNGNAMVLITSPIAVGEVISGAYLSFKMTRKNEEDNTVMKNMEQNKSHIALKTFDDIQYKSEKMHQVIERAKLFAQSNTPVMVGGQSGIDRESICQGIHNYSPRKKGPYVSVSMVGLSEEKQLDILFGSMNQDRRSGERIVGALEQADGGTLVINGIGFISKRTQSALCRFIRETSAVLKSNGEMKLLDVRIFITSTEELNYMRKQGKMTDTFYYIFSGLVLRIPPLQERGEDIENFVKIYLERYTQRYSRYQALTTEAMEYLKSYNWQGSGLQIERFVERMVLTVEKRTIKKPMVESLLGEMYPLTEEPDRQEEAQPKQDPYEKLLRTTLVECQGNRSETAKKLGISTTTLWRKMKKYGITE